MQQLYREVWSSLSIHWPVHWDQELQVLLIVHLFDIHAMHASLCNFIGGYRKNHQESQRRRQFILGHSRGSNSSNHISTDIFYFPLVSWRSDSLSCLLTVQRKDNKREYKTTLWEWQPVRQRLFRKFQGNLVCFYPSQSSRKPLAQLSRYPRIFTTRIHNFSSRNYDEIAALALLCCQPRATSHAAMKHRPHRMFVTHFQQLHL